MKINGDLIIEGTTNSLKNIKENCIPKVLYEHGNNNYTTINLVDNLQNYTAIDVYYITNDGISFCNTCGCDDPWNKKITMTFSYWLGSTCYLKSSVWQCSDNKIQFLQGGQVAIDSSGNAMYAGQYMFITKVVGWKYNIQAGATGSGS